MTRWSFVLTIALALVLGCPPEPMSERPPETDEEKAFYLTSFNIAWLMKRDLDPSDESVDFFLRGVRDALAGKESLVDRTFPAQRVLEGLSRPNREARRDTMVEDAKREAPLAAAYVEKAAAEPGAVTTETGVVYRELAAGTGAHPESSSKVRVHYHGTLRDGTVFDSSVERDTPAEFPVNGVIACWQEAIPKMRVGGKAVITCPPDRAYGIRAVGKIPSGAALTFEVELIAIL